MRSVIDQHPTTESIFMLHNHDERCKYMILNIDRSSSSDTIRPVIKGKGYKCRKWDKNRLLTEAYNIHGDKYLYHLDNEITSS